METLYWQSEKNISENRKQKIKRIGKGRVQKDRGKSVQPKAE